MAAITPREFVEGMEALGYRLYPSDDPRFAFLEVLPAHDREEESVDADIALRKRAHAIPGFNSRVAEYLQTTFRTYRPRC